MSFTKQTEQQVREFLEQNTRWSLENGKLYQKFVFKNFIEAFSFMTEVAFIAEQIDHHPEWFNVYKTVIVELTTHETDGLSDRDFEMARHMDRIATHRL